MIQIILHSYFSVRYTIIVCLTWSAGVVVVSTSFSSYYYYYLLYINLFSFSPHNHGGTHHCVDFFADIDECAQNTHNCSRDNATCTNTEGLFNCSCDPGFRGDGHNCAGVIIFQSMIAFPFQQVKHTSPDLLFHKNVKRVLLFFGGLSNTTAWYQSSNIFTSRRFMNIHCGNHENETSRKSVLSTH